MLADLIEKLLALVMNAALDVTKSWGRRKDITETVVTALIPANQRRPISLSHVQEVIMVVMNVINAALVTAGLGGIFRSCDVTVSRIASNHSLDQY